MFCIKAVQSEKQSMSDVGTVLSESLVFRLPSTATNVARVLQPSSVIVVLPDKSSLLFFVLVP